MALKADGSHLHVLVSSAVVPDFEYCIGAGCGYARRALPALQEARRADPSFIPGGFRRWTPPCNNGGPLPPVLRPE